MGARPLAIQDRVKCPPGEANVRETKVIALAHVSREAYGRVDDSPGRVPSSGAKLGGGSGMTSGGRDGSGNEPCERVATKKAG